MRAALLSLAGLLFAAGCDRPTNRTGAAFTATGELIALSGGENGADAACFTCHGLDGRGDGVSVPRLAGMPVGYLQKQMADYAQDLRADKVMGPIAKRLSDADVRAVAAHYARMTPAAGDVSATVAPAAYEPCAICHGDQGEGVGEANPSLAGQPAAYTLEQIDRWRHVHRRNDPKGVMSAAVSELSAPDAQAIAAWLGRQSASQPPDTDAASVSAAASALERWAASREARRPYR
ncbi:MAG: hypothetical protein B7Y99_12710 [Caulobacterales bacterium 32-69-10]|nr:MAG: hypothetical protein B7Y99_12710 [Caulobacterales bacterium 32-69-10]